MIKIFILLLPFLLVASNVKVKEITTTQSIKNYGYVTVDQSKVYDVSPRYSGYIEDLSVNKLYTKVKKDELLATVYSPEVLKAKEEYLNTFHYSKSRKKNGMLKNSKLKLKLLGLSDKEIKQTIKSKETNKNTNIYSPTNGYIFQKNINNNSAFKKNTKLFEIVNLDTIWIEVKLLEEQKKYLKDIKKFNIKFKSLDKTYSTTKSYLYPNLDPKESTLTLRLEVLNDGNIFPGMYANVTSMFQEQTYLTLPKTSVIRKNSKYYVFLVTEFKNEYDPQEVSVKVLDNNTYIILDGLKKGEEVVNDALFMLDSDAQINGLL